MNKCSKNKLFLILVLIFGSKKSHQQPFLLMKAMFLFLLQNHSILQISYTYKWPYFKYLLKLCTFIDKFSSLCDSLPLSCIFCCFHSFAPTDKLPCGYSFFQIYPEASQLYEHLCLYVSLFFSLPFFVLIDFRLWRGCTCLYGFLDLFQSCVAL